MLLRFLLVLALGMFAFGAPPAVDDRQRDEVEESFEELATTGASTSARSERRSQPRRVRFPRRAHPEVALLLQRADAELVGAPSLAPPTTSRAPARRLTYPPAESDEPPAIPSV